MITVSAQLDKLPAAVRPIVEAAITTIRQVAPRSEEIAYRMNAPRSPRMMWKLVRYAAGGENVVGVGTFARHSTMFFYRGRELDEGEGTLLGSGKDTRYVVLRSPADARSPAVRKLVKKAFALAPR